MVLWNKGSLFWTWIFLLNILLLFYNSCPNFSPFALLHPAHRWLPQSVPSLLPITMCPLHMSLTRPFPFFPPLSHSLLPSVTVSLFLVSLPLVIYSYFVSFIRFLLIGEVICICLSLPGLFHLAQYSPVPSMQFGKVGAPSFFLPHSIPLCKYIIGFWSTHLLMGT